MAITTQTISITSDGTKYEDLAAAQEHEQAWQAAQERDELMRQWSLVVQEFCEQVLEHPDNPRSRGRLANSSLRLIEWLLDHGFTIEGPAEQ